MNVVFDQGLSLNDDYREAFAAILPVDNAPLKLDSSTEKIDGTPIAEEGFVFLTKLEPDVLKYHCTFFERYKDSPQWFFVLLNRNDHGIVDLKNAARKCNLKNTSFFHAPNIEKFISAVDSIKNTKQIIKGKTLLFSKCKKNWTNGLARILFDNQRKYEIMDSLNVTDSDSDTLLLCGEEISDFTGFELPGNMEPYFIFRIKGELQHYINPRTLISRLSEHYHMTTERVEHRLYFIDIEFEHWLNDVSRTTGDDAVANGILIWDSFGLPNSRSEYTDVNIEKKAKRCHENIERLKKVFL